MQTGAARQPQQQRFGLVICSMGRSDGIYPLPLQLHKGRVAQTARPVLPGVRRGQCQLSGMEHPQRQAQPGADLPDEGFVPVRRLPPQTVVDVADREGDALFPGQRAHEAEQSHAVGPARNSQREMLFAVQQLFPGAEAAHRL